jgi:hypothetical protein
MRKLIIAVLALSLGGCAQQILQAAQQDCAAYGHPVGTPAYAQCVQSEVARRQAAVQRAFQQQPYQNTYQPIPTRQNAPAQSTGLMCFSKGETQSGMNKICYYDCAGSAAAMTVSAVTLCPLSIQR